MFEGVQTTGEGCVSAWLTNTTDFQVYVDAGEAIAFWEADVDGEFELAGSLTSEVEIMVNALNVKRSLSERIVDEEHAQRQTDAGAIASCKHVVNQIVLLVARLQRNIVAIMQMQMQLK